MKVLMLSGAISSHRGLLLATAAVVAFAACSTTPPVADELDRAKDLTASTLKATEASEVSEFVDELDFHSELSTVEEYEDEIPSGTSVTGKDANEGDFETTTSVLDSVAPSTTAAKTTGETSSGTPSSGSAPSQPDSSENDVALGETVLVLDSFENYSPTDAVPQTWFNYGNAGGGVDIVGVADPRSRSGQTGDNRLLAWGFDANSDPGYGGIGKEYPSPQNWSQYSGVKFWFYGSGEGGQLQIEIGEDKTTDVERYRAPTFVDNQLGWRLVRLDFDSFTPASWNPVPGNEVLDLLSVENIVFAANSGITSSGVAIDDVTLYSDGSDSSPSPTSTTSTTVPQPASSPPTSLVWSDEFNGSSINSSNWRYDIGGWGWGNGESQYYTDRQENARVSDGALIIEAHKEDYLGSSYTSARLLTQNLREFQYGRIEARVKVPAGTGTWPAFWMLGTGLGEPGRTWPNVGEIDILEYVGREPNVVIGALHGPGYSGGGAIDKWSVQNYEIANDWHVLAVEWNYSGITWFLDGNQFHSVTRDAVPGEWVFDQPFFIILNLAIGGTLGGQIDQNLQFPLRYYIDYVRVYQ